jgi:hypothetical protein
VWHAWAGRGQAEIPRDLLDIAPVSEAAFA